MIKELAAIERAQRDTITAIRTQTDSLLNPENRFFNLRSNFTLPSYAPAFRTSGATHGDTNVSVSFTGNGSKMEPSDIKKLAMEGVSEALYNSRGTNAWGSLTNGVLAQVHRCSGGARNPANPFPSDIEFPDADAVTVHSSVGGNVIFQRPLRDGRPRKWIFRASGIALEPYATQWALLQSLTAKNCRAASLSADVSIWEDVSGVGGLDRSDGIGNKVYTRVRIAQPNRVPRNGGGPVRYDSTLEFYIDDTSYTAF